MSNRKADSESIPDLIHKEKQLFADTATATATADSLFAKALTNSTFNDRTMIEDEIHGVSCVATKETTPLIKQSMIDFEVEVHKINLKPACNKARSSGSNAYHFPNTFWLRFLRCELFDVQKAIERYIKYLDFLREVYREYTLCRPIRMNDLTRDKMFFLKEG